MKKVLFVVALCAAVLAANAQDNPASAPKAKTQPTQQVAPVTGRPASIKEADLMKPIKDDYVKQVPGATFERAMKMEKKEGVVYSVIVKKDNVRWKLTYDKDGKFVKKDEMKMVEKKAPAPAQPAK